MQCGSYTIGADPISPAIALIRSCSIFEVPAFIKSIPQREKGDSQEGDGSAKEMGDCPVTAVHMPQ